MDHQADIPGRHPEHEEGHTAGTVDLAIGDRSRFRNYAVINLLNFLRKTLAEG